MLFDYVKDICRLLSVKYVSFPDFVWNAGGDINKSCYEPANADSIYSRRIVYIGNRQAISSLSSKTLLGSRVLMMIRDPRDCLVSKYFSFLGSHTAPAHLSDAAKKTWMENRVKIRTKTNIDNYVLENAADYVKNLQEMISFTKLSGHYLIVRYEDYIQNKKGLCDKIYKILSELKRPHQVPSAMSNIFTWFCHEKSSEHNEDLKKIAEKHDIIPIADRPDQHVRHALPGDHQAKLQMSTIDKLNIIFAPLLSEFGYIKDNSSKT